MSTALQFDATSVKPDAGQQDPVPAGWYTGVVTKGEVGPTTSGAGTAAKLQFEIKDPEWLGARVYHNFNIVNANEKTQEIAFAQLSALQHAVGVLQIQDLQQLYNRPFKMKLVIEPANGQWAAKNKIMAFKTIAEIPDLPPSRAAASATAGFMPPVAGAGFTPPPVGGAPVIPPVAAGGFTPPASQPWSPPAAAVAAPVIAPVPVIAPPVAPPVAPVVAAAPVKQMTALAGGASYEQFIAQGWTDEAMIANGYLTAPVAAPVTAPAGLPFPGQTTEFVAPAALVAATQAAPVIPEVVHPAQGAVAPWELPAQ